MLGVVSAASRGYVLQCYARRPGYNSDALNLSSSSCRSEVCAPAGRLQPM